MNDLTKKILIFVLAFVILNLLFGRVISPLLPVSPIMLVSDSMSPTYDKGHVVYIGQSNEYRVNDVILYDHTNLPNKALVRIIEVNPDGSFKVKGDNPVTNAEPITQLGQESVRIDQIDGKAVFSFSPFIWFPLRYGIIILLSILATHLIFLRMKK